jgi:hypothetical protein
MSTSVLDVIPKMSIVKGTPRGFTRSRRSRRFLLTPWQSGNPAFGAGFQGGDVLMRKIKVHYPIEKSGRLVNVKTQVGGAQFS